MHCYPGTQSLRYPALQIETHVQSSFPPPPEGIDLRTLVVNLMIAHILQTRVVAKPKCQGNPAILCPFHAVFGLVNLTR